MFGLLLSCAWRPRQAHNNYAQGNAAPRPARGLYPGFRRAQTKRGARCNAVALGGGWRGGGAGGWTWALQSTMFAAGAAETEGILAGVAAFCKVLRQHLLVHVGSGWCIIVRFALDIQ